MGIGPGQSSVTRSETSGAIGSGGRLRELFLPPIIEAALRGFRRCRDDDVTLVMLATSRCRHGRQCPSVVSEQGETKENLLADPVMPEPLARTARRLLDRSDWRRPILLTLENRTVFKTTRQEALVKARRLVRGFASAPEQRRHAQQIYGALVHAEGWSPAQEALILELGAWLQGRPSLGELKPRCDTALDKLA